MKSRQNNLISHRAQEETWLYHPPHLVPEEPVSAALSIVLCQEADLASLCFYLFHARFSLCQTNSQFSTALSTSCSLLRLRVQSPATFLILSTLTQGLCEINVMERLKLNMNHIELYTKVFTQVLTLLKLIF